MLQHGQGVVDDLTNRLVSEDTDYSTHRPSLPRAHSQFHTRTSILLRLPEKYFAVALESYVAEMKSQRCF
jgi:hypothetical protein